MKRPDFDEDALELELARLRARHHIHDASRILVDAGHLVPRDSAELWTSIIGGLNTLERHLDDLGRIAPREGK